MIESLLQQLQSPDPAERKQAIVALANTRNPEALAALQHVYQNDPELELREMALKAGRYIHMATTRPAGSASPASPKPITGPVQPLSPTPITGPIQPLSPTPITGPVQPLSAAGEVTQRDVELARGHLDAATGYFTQGDRARAIDSLGKALALNPRLQREPFAANLITTLTGRPVSEGVPILISPQARADLVIKAGGKPKYKAQAHGKGADTATWPNVLLDLALYGLITALATLAIFTVGLEGLKDAFEEYSALNTYSGAGYDWDTVADLSLVFLFMMAVATGISSMIGMVIQSAGIHVAATMVLGGNGTLVLLLRRYVPFQTVVMFIYGIVSVISFVLLPSQPSLVTILSILLIPASVGLIYYSAALVADVYHFGWGSGCGAIIVGGIIVGAGLFLCNCLASSALVNTGTP
jgi:tetratricopeptide (TPR) repeat protein